MPAALPSTALWLPRLSTLPPLALPPVKDDVDLFVPGEIPPQILAEIRGVSCHDEQVASLVPWRVSRQRLALD
ncbi:MAG: hypothetical protein WAP47_10290 [Candidatus Rokuibacteriota bacterium]